MDDHKVTPFSLQDVPALIEKLLPVQKLSIEAYKESQAVHGKTLTALGSYWKGRKALILNRACVLGALLPATDNPQKDLEIFEMLMGFDMESLKTRLAEKLSERVFEDLKSNRFRLSYSEMVDQAARPEECSEDLYGSIWKQVNSHLGTEATNIPELVEQLGIMRFGHRPKVADTFSGSGQIPFEAARLGCDVYASDLSPVAAMLTWGDLNIVGGSKRDHDELQKAQQLLVEQVQSDIDTLGIETDGHGWRGKVYLYCVEVTCPQTGWKVPLLPKLIVSKGYKVVAKLIAVPETKSYQIDIVSDATVEELEQADLGTVRGDELVHVVDGIEYRTRISTIRGDYRKPDGTNGNGLRMWGMSDFIPREEDIFGERLFAVQWMRPKNRGSGFEYQFRSVTEEDLEREHKVQEFIADHLDEWQEAGWIPDMKIEPGDKTDEPIRTRGWTHWHHLFNPRQLLAGGLINRYSDAKLKFGLAQVLNWNSRLSIWNYQGGGGGIVQNTFFNQALNTLWNYGCRASDYFSGQLTQTYKSYPLLDSVSRQITTLPANQVNEPLDIAITDPPYGDAVKYEEIYEFFIAWLRKNPPPEFAGWIWDSRRALAIKGEDHDFKLEMIKAYSNLTRLMPHNGLQIIMFTHQSGSIWADLANIVWASGLQVTAAWYVVTETDSALREGSYVKGTVLLVCRKRADNISTSRDELAYEIESEVKAQVAILTGLNQETKDLYRGENLFEDADLQMAGYAAALRVLTKYSIIDGIDMAGEALRPRVKKQSTLVDGLIDFAVSKANEFLVPQGLSQSVWDKLNGIERFYLKMVDMESKEFFILSNYQNFAKAFKIKDFSPLMEESKANKARLKGAVALNKRYMGSTDEFGPTLVRALLYGVYLLTTTSTKGEEVLAQLKSLIPNYYRDRGTLISVSEYLSQRTAKLYPEESNSAIILRDLLRNERM